MTEQPISHDDALARYEAGPAALRAASHGNRTPATDVYTVLRHGGLDVYDGAAWSASYRPESP